MNENIIRLTTPLNNEVVSKLKIGDVVTISGQLLTARDQAHKRIVEEGSPIDLNNTVIFHAGPIVRTRENLKSNDFEIVAI